MKHLIDKEAVVAKIESELQGLIACKENTSFIEHRVVLQAKIDMCNEILSFLDTLEVKEVNSTNMETSWRPSSKQIESLRDMLKYNIGVFDYQKFMEVNSLYDDLTKIYDYETGRQK